MSLFKSESVTYAKLYFEVDNQIAMSDEQRHFLRLCYESQIKIDNVGMDKQKLHSIIAQNLESTYDHEDFVRLEYFDEKDNHRGSVYLHNWRVA